VLATIETRIKFVSTSPDFPEEKPDSPTSEPLPPPEQPITENTTEAAPGLESLPPEAQGDTNGGPLGCCLGIMVGLLLSLSIAVVSRLYPDLFIQIFGEHLSIATKIIMILVLVAGSIIFGTVGWRSGRRFYREYEPSQRYLRKMAKLEQRERAYARRKRHSR
jgi:hypothetical protein